jgi:DNA-binding transcriptional LysR family regulator
MLDATRLRILVAVARYGSVTAAAQALNYAQPSISHHIARLEAETGAKLMERVGRGVRLTDAGRLLAERAEEILGRLDAAEAELAMHVGLRQDRVRLAAFGSALATLVAAAGAALRLEGADSGVHLAKAEPAPALRMLRAGETDIALIFRYRRDGSEPDGLLESAGGPSGHDGPTGRLLLDEPVYLISRARPAPGEPATAPAPAHASGRREPGLHRTPSDSDIRSAILAAHASERWIGAEEQCTDLLIDLCRSAGFGPDIAISSADFVTAQALTAAGLGVSVLPGLALRAARHPGIEATELPGTRRQVLAVSYPASPNIPAARFIEAMVHAGGQAVHDHAGLSVPAPTSWWAPCCR